MPRYLYLLRHAKSDWSADDGDDHNRSLNRRGEQAASRMGRWLTALGETPDLVLSSTALRARDTVERAMAAGGWSCPMELSRQLYLTSPAAVLAEIQQARDSVVRLLVAGHQPVSSELAGMLIGEGSETARLKFPTTALARIDFDTDRWRDAQPGRGTLKWLVTPKVVQKAVKDSR